MIKTSHSIDLNELCKGKIPISLIYEVKYFIEENNMEFTTYDQFNTVISFESYDDARMMLNWIENTTFPETLFPSLDEYLLSATIAPCVYHIPEDKALSDCHLTTFTDEMYELWKKFKPLCEKELTGGILGVPEQMASIILFLSSDDASYITGTVISGDFGSSAN